MIVWTCRHHALECRGEPAQQNDDCMSLQHLAMLIVDMTGRCSRWQIGVHNYVSCQVEHTSVKNPACTSCNPSTSSLTLTYAAEVQRMNISSLILESTIRGAGDPCTHRKLRKMSHAMSREIAV